MKRGSQSNALARECIVTALIQLASQKEFSAITVSELTERAGVSRMTYYRNYHSKEEVFRTYMDEIIEAFRSEISRIKKPEQYGEYESILYCCRYFEKYKDFIACLNGIGMSYILLEALTRYLLSTFYVEGRDTDRLYYELLAYAGALFNVYLAWLHGGAIQPVEALADFLYTQFRRD